MSIMDGLKLGVGFYVGFTVANEINSTLDILLSGRFKKIMKDYLDDDNASHDMYYRYVETIYTKLFGDDERPVNKIGF